MGILLDGRGDLLSLETYPGRFAEPYGSSKTVAQLHGLRVGRRSDLTVQEHSVSGMESRTWILIHALWGRVPSPQGGSGFGYKLKLR